MLNFKRHKPLSWLALFLSTGFLTGLVPEWIHPKLKGKGGGFMGSLVGLALLYPLWTQHWCDTPELLLITCILTFPPLGTWIVGEGERMMFVLWGPRRRHTGDMVESDFNQTNYDEIVGMFWAALIVWPLHEPGNTWPLLGIFMIFRVLDTKKPWPISYVEKKWQFSHPAISVIADDVAAGIGAGLITMVATAFFP